eukprot:14311854-Ditylum_brightwellii.AAC.1
MKEPDTLQFVEAAVSEVNENIERGYWTLIFIEEVPNGTKILDAVWVMKRKGDIKTREVTKYNARLNVHGGQQKHGINYVETYVSVNIWPSVRMFLAFEMINS